MQAHGPILVRPSTKTVVILPWQTSHAAGAEPVQTLLAIGRHLVASCFGVVIRWDAVAGMKLAPALGTLYQHLAASAAALPIGVDVDVVDGGSVLDLAGAAASHHEPSVLVEWVPRQVSDLLAHVALRLDVVIRWETFAALACGTSPA
jgi:hypothetical protein